MTSWGNHESRPGFFFLLFLVTRLVRRFRRDAAGLIVIEFRGGCSVDSSTCKGSQRGKPCFLCSTLLSTLTRTLPKVHISPPQSTRAGVISRHKLPDSRLNTFFCKTVRSVYAPKKTHTQKNHADDKQEKAADCCLRLLEPPR